MSRRAGANIGARNGSSIAGAGIGGTTARSPLRPRCRATSVPIRAIGIRAPRSRTYCATSNTVTGPWTRPDAACIRNRRGRCGRRLPCKDPAERPSRETLRSSRVNAHRSPRCRFSRGTRLRRPPSPQDPRLDRAPPSANDKSPERTSPRRHEEQGRPRAGARVAGGTISAGVRVAGTHASAPRRSLRRATRNAVRRGGWSVPFKAILRGLSNASDWG